MEILLPFVGWWVLLLHLSSESASSNIPAPYNSALITALHILLKVREKELIKV